MHKNTPLNRLGRLLLVGGVVGSMAAAQAATITLLESFEDDVDNVGHLTESPDDNPGTNRRISTFEQSDDNSVSQVTDGTRALRVSFDSMSGWQRDFQVVLDVEASRLIEEAVLEQETGRYYLLYDITWENTGGGAGWANNPIEIGGWLYGDQVEWGGGGAPVTMAYELAAGTPEGFGLNTVGDNGDQTFLNFIFNSNTSDAMVVSVDNIRLLDTRPSNNAETVVTVLNSFEDDLSALMPSGRAEGPTANEDERFVSHGSKSAKIVLTGDGTWSQDGAFDLTSDALFEILELPREERLRYTLAWDWFVLLDDTAAPGWGLQQAYSPGSPEQQLTQAWGGNEGMRTRLINLGLVDWEAPPALTIIHNGGWSGGSVNVFMDNLRLIDTGFVPNVFGLENPAVGDSGFSFSWASQAGKNYQVHRTTAVGQSWETVAELTADSDQTTYADGAAPAGEAFYRVANIPSPPVFEDDFESGGAGWTTLSLNPGSTTAWELGTPASGHGPGGANSGSNVYGTDLDADYQFNTEILLQSPLIDLSNAPAATLVFWTFQDVEPLFDGEFVDFVEVFLADAAGIPLATEPLRRRAGIRAEWQQERIRLPAEALGRSIRLQFKFTSDTFNMVDSGGNDVTQAGWFIDDVVVLPE